MLRQRVLTALVLVSLLAAALFLLPLPAWWGVCGLVALAAGWEWGGLAQLAPPWRWLLGGVAALLSVALAAWHDLRVDLLVFAGSALFWLLLAPAFLKQRWQLPAPLSGALGVLTVVAAALALARLREGGPWWVLAIMAVVWVADIAAYFGGRALGRNKLAPAISPGKSWEGAVCGVLGSAVYGGLVFEFGFRDVPAQLGWVIALWMVLVLAGLSIVGDLFESLLKRQAGLKDSSHLLPGHGGVLDRIDGLLPTLPLAALWYFIGNL